MRLASNIAITIRLVFSLLLACLLSACSGLYFFPMKKLVRVPADVGLQYEDKFFATHDNLRIHAWLLKSDRPRGVVYFLHGNAENISTHLASVYWLPEQGFDVLMLDYRGYGLSEGNPTIPEVFEDVDIGYQWLKQYAAKRNLPLFVLGQSLGASIGVYYFGQLSKEDSSVNGVILDATFSGYQDIAKDRMSRNVITWPFQLFTCCMVSSDYDPKQNVARISPTPLLFFHSRDDQIIPYEEGEEVFGQAKEPKSWVSIHGPHISTFNNPENRKLVLDFMLEHGASTGKSVIKR